MKNFIRIALVFFVCAEAYASACTNCADYQPADVTCKQKSACTCTDPGAKRNNCLSEEKYCEAFGNVGAN